MSETLIISILAASITAGTPILFAALGELIAERSGIMNLGVDGMMLVGAVTGFMITVNTGNPWLGVGTALVAGGLLALIHAYLTVTLRANQVVADWHLPYLVRVSAIIWARLMSACAQNILLVSWRYLV